MSKAIDDVLAERQRQIEQEGWTEQHDAQHDKGALAMAGACYAAHVGAAGLIERRHANLGPEQYAISKAQDFVRWSWPWSREWWKPKDPRRDLVRAAALIIAEIERLDRVES